MSVDGINPPAIGSTNLNISRNQAQQTDSSDGIIPNRQASSSDGIIPNRQASSSDGIIPNNNSDTVTISPEAQNLLNSERS